MLTENVDSPVDTADQVMQDADDATKPRLIIERIIVDNFKSYLGRHIIGPFHRSFSAIVGPNGSGKSNVIDALMFVLGSRAKRLRQGKLGDLVHNSEGAEGVESCTVEICFAECIDDPSSGASSIIDGSQFVVSRQAWRNSRNQYAINGQVCQQADVYGLLKGHGVDLDHKRFLILQGEVELIAQMKAKAANEHEEGLLEYLEDIIGTAHYADQIEECGKTVDTANNTCSERLLRARHCEKELNALAEEKETAELYLKLESQIVDKKSELFQVLRFQLEKQLTKTTEALGTATAALTREQEKNAQQVEAVDKIEVELKERNSAFSAVEREAEELMKRMKRLENEDVSLREKKTHLKKKLANLGKSGAEAEKRKGETERELSNLAVERERLDKQIGELVIKIEENEKELSKIQDSLRGKTDSLQQDLARQQSAIQPFQEAVRKAQGECDIALSALNDLQVKLSMDEQELERVRQSIEVVERDLADAQENQLALSQQQKDLQKQSVKFMEQRQMAETKYDQVGKDLSILQSTIAEARESQANHRAVYRNQAIAALMKDAKKIGGGIYGRLGDLGVIESKYDVAVSTAAPQLHYMVVDNTETAQRCVEYLRKNNLGRASFIILDRMRTVSRSNIDLPSGILKLFDLITAKDKMFEPAFAFAVGDTFVADTMEVASKWAFDGARRNRVVTIDGKLIDTSGTMSGGGKQVSRGAMRIKNNKHDKNDEDSFDDDGNNVVSDEQIAELQSLIEQKQEEQRILKAMISEFQQSLQAVCKELKRVELEQAKAEQVNKSLPLQLSDLIAQRDDLVSKQKNALLNSSLNKEQSLLRDNLERARQSLNKAQSAMAPHLAKLQAIEEKIMDAGGVQYKVQRAKLEGMREQLALAEARLGKVVAEMTVLGGGDVASRRDPEREAKLRKEEESIQADLTGLEDQMEQNLEQAMLVKTRLDELTGSLEEQRDAIEDLKKTLEQHNRTLSKFRKHEYELKMKREELESECEARRADIRRYEQALMALNEDDLSGYTKRDVEELQQEIAQLEARLANIPNPNIAILEEWARQKALFEQLDGELRQAEEHRAAIRAHFDALRKSRFDEFMAGLRHISHHLKQLYQLLTMGGNAELELVDSLDPFTEGVQFSVMPPKKSWKSINNLSGGEKTLASLSLIFALHAYKPTPVYVMDEIDAALDFRNVSIVANYIKQRCCRAQFIVISLRSDMFELADRLIGVYKVDQRTRSVCIDPRHFVLSV